MDRPEGLLSAPDATVTKVASPAKGSIGSQMSLIGSTHDPMRGHFISDSDPRAAMILAQQQEHVRKLQHRYGSGRHQPKHLNGGSELEPGHIVIHAERGRGVVAKFSEDGHRTEVIFGGGKVALVQTKKLKRVK